jgi:intracellular multiplication protein IcmO
MSRHQVELTPFPFWGLNREQMILAGATCALLVIVALVHVPWLSLFHWLWSLVRGIPKNAITIGRAYLPDNARLRHTHIVGATGTGKTVLLEQLLFQDLKRGYGAIVIDPKGERSFYESVRNYCRLIGREKDLVLLSATHPNESAFWNPCALGRVSELQSKFYNSATYSEPHYAKACEYALATSFGRLSSSQKGVVTLKDVLRELDALAKGDRHDIFQGLYFDLHNLLASEWEQVLLPQPNSNSREISILEIITGNKILFVDLPTEGKRVQSSRIGRLLTQEIILISGMRKRSPALLGDRPFSIYIDEFDAFATESFSTFLNKGRSSEFMIHLAHQTLSDLNQISPEFAGQILGNCNVRFIFRQDDPDDAERWSRFIGTRKTIKRTYSTQNGMQTGDASNRETQEFIVAPDTIKTLPIGRCVFSMKTEGVCRVMKIPFRRQKRVPVQVSNTPVAPSPTPLPELPPVAPAPVLESLGAKRCTRIEKSVSFSPVL